MARALIVILLWIAMLVLPCVGAPGSTLMKIEVEELEVAPRVWSEARGSATVLGWHL